MLIHVNALAEAPRVEAVQSKSKTTANPVKFDKAFLLSAFPNHFVVLLSEVVPDTSKKTVSLSAWTWAGSYVFEGIPVSDLSTNYYGAVRTTLKD